MNNVSPQALPQTKHLDSPNSPALQPARIRPPLIFTPANAPWRLTFQIGTDSVSSVQLDVTTQISIGRSDILEGHIPGLDLTPFGARDKGISRRHALLSGAEGGLYIRDLNSTNGTRLNGFTLHANEPYKISQGDEIEFGHLRMMFNVL